MAFHVRAVVGAGALLSAAERRAALRRATLWTTEVHRRAEAAGSAADVWSAATEARTTTEIGATAEVWSATLRLRSTAAVGLRAVATIVGARPERRALWTLRRLRTALGLFAAVVVAATIHLATIAFPAIALGARRLRLTRSRGGALAHLRHHALQLPDLFAKFFHLFAEIDITAGLRTGLRLRLACLGGRLRGTGVGTAALFLTRLGTARLRLTSFGLTGIRSGIGPRCIRPRCIRARCIRAAGLGTARPTRTSITRPTFAAFTFAGAAAFRPALRTLRRTRRVGTGRIRPAFAFARLRSPFSFATRTFAFAARCRFVSGANRRHRHSRA